MLRGHTVCAYGNGNHHSRGKSMAGRNAYSRRGYGDRRLLLLTRRFVRRVALSCQKISFSYFFTAVKFTTVAKTENYFENLSLSRNDFLPEYAQHLQQERKHILHKSQLVRKAAGHTMKLGVDRSQQTHPSNEPFF